MNSPVIAERDVASVDRGDGATVAPRAPTYLSHIDGLRAIAILLVVANHAWPAAVPGGFIGVDIFFVVSGYIITRQISNSLASREFSYRRFLARRIRRLIPAAFVCFAGVSLLCTIFFLPNALIDYAHNLVAANLMYANIYNAMHSGYFDAPSVDKPLLHIWSLSIEDQFYIAWPLLLLFMDHVVQRPATKSLVIVAAAAMSLTYAAAIVGRYPDFAFYVIFPRCFPLLFGCALAVITRNDRAIVLGPMADALAVAAILASGLLLNGGTAYPGLATLPVCLGTLALILSGLRGGTFVAKLLGAGCMVRTGRISYSLYLWHWPLLALAHYRAGRSLTWMEAAFLVATAVAISAASWRFVEQPFRRKRLRLKPTYAMAAASIALTCGLALALIDGKGWAWRLDKPQRDLFVQMLSKNPLRGACYGSRRAFENDESCNFGSRFRASRQFDMAIFGDSNADHFVPMIADLAARRGLRGRQVTQSTCAPLIGAARQRPPNEEEACTTFQATMLTFLARNPNLKLAILSAVWSGYYGALQPNRLAATLKAPPPADFDGYVTATVRLLRDRGIKVMIIGQIPFLDDFPLQCFLNAVESGVRDGKCGIPRRSVDAALSHSLAIFRRLAAQDPGVTLFDPASVLCGPGVCSPFMDGVFAYHDPGHLNAFGALALARYASLPPGL